MKNDSKWVGLLLDNSGFIVVNKALIKTLGLECSVLLGELISEYNYYEKVNELTDKIWFYSTTPNIEEQTGLYRKTIEKNINKLKNENLIDVKIIGMPRKRYIKINFKEVEKFIKKSIKNLSSRDKNTYKQGQKDIQARIKKHTSKDNNTSKKGQKDIQVGTKDTINNNNNNNKKKNNKTNLILSRQDEKDAYSLYNNFLNRIDLNNLLIEYEDKPTSKKNLQDILNIIKDLYKLKNNEYIMISGKKVYAGNIIETLNNYDENTIKYVLKSIRSNASNIKNIKSYTIAILYNAPRTINLYYQAKINNDMRKDVEQRKIEKYTDDKKTFLYG